MIFVGTSGWQYADWRARFYPDGLPEREWLTFFAGSFATTEVNNTFYRLPEGSVFERWKASTPDGFVMAIKASRFITHVKRLRESDEAVARLWDRGRLLGTRLGPVLFQLPPRFPLDLARLRSFLAALPRLMHPAFEFRDRSWHTAEVFDSLDAHGAALVWADRPGVRHTLPITGGWMYLRLHQGHRLGPDYPNAKLRRLADRIAELHVSDAFVYFNNDQGAAAVRDARRLVALLVDREVGVASPPRLGGRGPASHLPLPWHGKPRRARADG